MPKWRTHLHHGMPLISTGQGRLFLPQGGTASTSSRIQPPLRGPMPTLRQTLLERPITSMRSVQRTSPQMLSEKLGGPSLLVLLETSRRMRSGAQTWCIRRPAMQACRRLLPELRSSSICASRNPTCYPMRWARRIAKHPTQQVFPTFPRTQLVSPFVASRRSVSPTFRRMLAAIWCDCSGALSMRRYVQNQKRSPRSLRRQSPFGAHL